MELDLTRDLGPGHGCAGDGGVGAAGAAGSADGAAGLVALSSAFGSTFTSGGSAASGVKTIYYAIVTGSIFTPASTTDLHTSTGVVLN